MDNKYRPIYHFTPKFGFVGDPNGLVYYKGTYHLFFQHVIKNYKNPVLGPVCWGHATSKDLINWEELEPAVLDTQDYSCLSGSGIVDYKNVSGLKDGEDDPILLFWTCCRGGSLGVMLNYSTDGGKTFKNYRNATEQPEVYSWRGNRTMKDYPTVVLDNGFIEGVSDRDPRVFYYAPNDTYILVMYIEYHAKGELPGYGIFSSKNLLDWTYESEIPGMCECPDLFELKVENTNETKWVLHACNGDYFVGDFDGHKFTPCQERNIDGRNSSDYAHQTWLGDRVIQTAFLRTKYRDTDFNQCLTFPVELTLRKENEIYYLIKNPIRELEKYKKEVLSFENLEIKGNLFEENKYKFETCEIDVEFEYNPLLFIAQIDTNCGNITYNGPNNSIEATSPNVHVRSLFPDENNMIKFKILVDQQSVEIFAGKDYMAFDRYDDIEYMRAFFWGNKPTKIKSFKVYEIRK